MPDFTALVDDVGRAISLTRSPPKLVKVFCGGTVLRSLERESGDKFHVGSRLCWGVPKRLLASKKITGLKRGMTRAQATKACWTAGDAAD
eukprot:2548964-Pyramimonas_sp.AAC.1